jgi:hypothetical protein
VQWMNPECSEASDSASSARPRPPTMNAVCARTIGTRHDSTSWRIAAAPPVGSVASDIASSADVPGGQMVSRIDAVAGASSIFWASSISWRTSVMT